MTSVFGGLYYTAKLKDELYKGRTLKKAHSEAAKKAIWPTIDASLIVIILGIFIYIFAGDLARKLGAMMVVGGFVTAVMNLLFFRIEAWLLCNDNGLQSSFPKMLNVQKDKIPDMESLSNDIFGANVYVFTPLGKVVDLPTGATTLDFAYKIHTKVGDSAVGAIVNGTMAIAEMALRAGYPEGDKLINHYTYCLCGDGCLEEGLSQEAISLAGHLRLNKLILFYDENGSTLDGPTSNSLTENVKMRFLSAEWNVLEVKDGNDVLAIDRAIRHDDLEILCADIRQEIIKETSLYGGHLSSNLGTVELTVALYRSFNFPKDKLIFDVGHQCYTHKILTGRSLAHLNEKGQVSGFEKRSESIYDCYEAGHSSTSLSAAEAFAIARDQRGEKYNVVALIGDASIVNGLSFEALNSIGSRPNKVIIVLNDNDMVSCVGKISDILNDVGVVKTVHTVSNEDGMDKTIAQLKNDNWTGLCFVNLVEFDSEYGHRRNAPGYAHALEALDKRLAEFIAAMAL